MVSNYALSLCNSIFFVGYIVDTGTIYFHFKGHLLQFWGCIECHLFKYIAFYSFVMQLHITATANIQLDATLILRHP